MYPKKNRFVIRCAIRQQLLLKSGLSLSLVRFLCKPERDNGLFINGNPSLFLSYGTKTTRKPTLLLRLLGFQLLRLATRQFVELLFQLPPRITRLEPSANALTFVVYPLPKPKRIGLGYIRV